MPAGRRRKVVLAVASVLVALVLGEAALQVLYRVRHGEWLPSPRAAWSRGVFAFHPFLAVTPRPGASATSDEGVVVTIGADGTRSLGAQTVMPDADAKTVACLGGSSTFGVAVSDGDTWPAALQAALGTPARVVNMGCPGYTTAENVIQTALVVPARSAKVCVYLAGWNDAHVMHIPDLEPDYSGWHGRFQLTNCQVIPSQDADTKVALLWYLDRLRIGFAKDAYAEFRERPLAERTTVDRVDPVALALYRRNLRTLATLCRSQGAVPVFVPQVLNWKLLDRDGAYGWAPRVADRFWKTAMDAYAAAMRDVATEEKVLFADAVLVHDWTPEDFADVGHFTPAGSRTFARLVAPVVESALRQAR
jgi:lysophospholipase L1-like esterase